MITSTLPTPTASPSKASGGSGAKASSDSAESEFQHLMKSPADAPPRSGHSQTDRAAAPGKQAATGDANRQDDEESASDETGAALPEQLLTLIGWPPTASPPAPGGLVPPVGEPAGSAGAATQGALLPPSIATLAADGLETGTAATAARSGASAGLAAGAAPAVGDPALPGFDATAAAAMPVDADVAPADFARMFALAADADVGNTGEVPGRAEAGDGGVLLSSTPAPAVSTRNPAAAVAAVPITMPADPDAGFDDAFGARISWMAEQRIGRAELRLNPEHLGVIDIRLQIDGNRISAEFQSANADVRQALENSVGRLRDMLGQQGLQLAQSDVGQGRGDRQAGRSSDARGDEAAGSGLDRMEPASASPVRMRGLLDEYA